MEKKNTILLTVIAIATLLVAVVGATFAYFTATVTTNTEDGNNTTTVTTRTMATATMDMGSKIEATNVLPGYKAVKSVTVQGGGKAGDQAVKAKISVTPTIDPAFGSDVSWTLYKSASPVTCPEPTVNIEGGQYSNTVNCTIPEGAKTVLTGSTSPATTEAFDVEYNTDDTYYLVVEYANNGDQSTQAGKNFTVSLGFEAA